MTAGQEDWLRLPAGSREELVANFLKEPDRGRYRALTALRNTVLAAGSGDEPAVSAVKLGWWRDELERLLRDAPRHPLTIALAASLDADSELLAWLEEIVVAADAIGRREQPETLQDLRLLCFRRDAVALTVGALRSVAEDDGRRARAKHVGIASAMAAIAGAVAAGRNRFLVPTEVVTEHVAPGNGDSLRAGDRDDDSAIRAIAAAGLEEIASAPAPDADADPATTILGAVTAVELRARRAHPARPAYPLQLLWHAWRAARRAAASTRD